MFKIFGDKGGLEWHQETPNTLLHMPKDDFSRTITRRRSDLVAPEALRVTRTEIGHPEGYLEAFANIYVDVAWGIATRRGLTTQQCRSSDLPTALDGAAGLAFVEAAISSSRMKAWVKIPRVQPSL
jgi:predicted dehydrogenase